MFWNKRASPEQKAEALGEILLEYVPETASLLISRVRQHKPNVDEVDAFRLLLELFVFYMHILDRLAFRELGPQQKPVFGDRLIITVANGITTRLHHDLSSVNIIAELRDTFNLRQKEYAGYRKLLPEGEEGTRGSLFWEVAKRLFYLCINNDDTLALLDLHMTLTTATVPFLKRANAVLRG